LRKPSFVAAILFGFTQIAFAEPVPFSCAIQPDGKTVSVKIKNPFDRETSCQVNCQISTQQKGTEFQISCTRTVAAGTESEICSKVYEEGGLTTMRGGDGDCIRQQSLEEQKQEEDKSDAETDALMRQMMKDGR
jgi:hypothetical protein